MVLGLFLLPFYMIHYYITEHHTLFSLISTGTGKFSVKLALFLVKSILLALSLEYIQTGICWKT